MGFTTSSSEINSPEPTTFVLSLASESSTNNTLHREHPSVLLHSHKCGITNLCRSVRSGISPNRCATASSCITEEFSSITTSSIEKVGTSLILNLLSAFTYCRGILLNSITTRLSFFSVTFIDGESKPEFSHGYINSLKNLPNLQKDFISSAPCTKSSGGWDLIFYSTMVTGKQ